MKANNFRKGLFFCAFFSIIYLSLKDDTSYQNVSYKTLLANSGSQLTKTSSQMAKTSSQLAKAGSQVTKPSELSKNMIPFDKYVPLELQRKPRFNIPLKFRIKTEKPPKNRNWRRTKKLSRIKKEPKMKYILLWTSPVNVPFVYMKQGQQVFIEKECPYTNCFVTNNESLLGDYAKFDVIAFAGPEVIHLSPEDLPRRRSPHQKYVFASIESAQYYPVCSDRFDGFFNWTWTYKLDSDARWGYIVIRDSNGYIVGPNKEMHWLRTEEIEPVTEELKDSFRKKWRAAAWFASNCQTKSGRERLVNALTKELLYNGLTITTYGECGKYNCTREDETSCDSMIETDFYFYLSLENAISEDYVTEKLLTAVQNNVIPIVYGGANYTRFMPDGSYLDAMYLHPTELAAKMYELILDLDKYSEYFKWRTHYSYHKKSEVPETDDYCGFCSLLNDEARVKKTTIYQDFRKWWNPPRVAPECALIEPLIRHN